MSKTRVEKGVFNLSLCIRIFAGVADKVTAGTDLLLILMEGESAFL